MTKTTPTTGTLYLVPAPLDFGCDSQAPLTQVLPEGTLKIAAGLQHWVCENAKTTRAYLQRINEIYPLSAPLQSQQIQELPREVHKKGDHLGNFDAKFLLKAAVEGHAMGLISEAGMPAIADPGSSVVRAAHDLGIQVLPLIGPVSLLLALAASGLNGQNFAFVGYLPQTATERIQRIRELELIALKTGQSQICIETPYRNAALHEALVKTLQPTTRLSISHGLTLENAQTQSQIISHWRQKNTAPPDKNRPAVFAFGK